MSRFKIRIEEADFKFFGGGGGYMVKLKAKLLVNCKMGKFIK